MNNTGPITIAPKLPKALPSEIGRPWWAKAKPEGFTQTCQKLFTAKESPRSILDIPREADVHPPED